MKSGVSGSSFQRGFGRDGESSSGSFIGARALVGGGGAVSIVPFTSPILSGVSVYVHGYTPPTRNAGIVESGHRGRGARGPDISVDDRVDSLVGHSRAAAKAAKSEMVGPRTTGGGTTAVPVVEASRDSARRLSPADCRPGPLLRRSPLQYRWCWRSAGPWA